jgi:hypothetical protein
MLEYECSQRSVKTGYRQLILGYEEHNKIRIIKEDNGE